MKRLPALIVAAVIGLTASACGAVTPYAATVNGVKITQGQLDDELDAIRANTGYVEGIEAGQLAVAGQGDDTFSTAFVARVLTRQIYLELVEQELDRRDLEVGQAELRQAEADVVAGFRGPGDDPSGQPKVWTEFPKDYRDLLVERAAQVSVLQQALAGVEVDDAAVAAFYEDNAERFQQTCARHILTEAQPEAEAARARVAAGEDFAAVAAAVSKDPGSAAEGGSLGCVGAGNFVPEFETAMDALQPGQTSEVVQTQFGFHVIQVTERKPQPLEEVEAQIRQQLLGDAEGEFNEFVTTAVDEAEVTINPRYGTVRKDAGQLEVVPPDAPTTTTSSTLPEVPLGRDPSAGDAPPPSDTPDP